MSDIESASGPEATVRPEGSAEPSRRNVVALVLTAKGASDFSKFLKASNGAVLLVASCDGATIAGVVHYPLNFDDWIRQGEKGIISIREYK